MLDIDTLNPAQREAVTAPPGPMLVVAGAGSGKTRTIVYRLAWLVEQGAHPASMLLLTFTRKAAQEMLHRAATLLGSQLVGVQGGTFHAFAFSVLRHYPPQKFAGMKGGLTVLDSADASSALGHCKEKLAIGKGDRSFPKSQTLLGLFSKARNKELAIGDLVMQETPHLLGYVDDMTSLEVEYRHYRLEHGLLDYDDLLFELEDLLRESPDILQAQRRRFQTILVDEYQDTNPVQARLVRLLAGTKAEGSIANVMAVGDDAQSIYAFRGASVKNILEFPALFEGTRIVRLEENYRSIQPVLDVANAILADAPVGYEKHLFSHRPFEEAERAVRLFHPMSDRTQATLVARRIAELLDDHPPHEIAVLFRAGFHSYPLEVELNKCGIPFKKYGGLKYTEAAHIKDIMAYARLVVNPLDEPSFQRISALCKGIGPKTANKLFIAITEGKEKELVKAFEKYPELKEDMALLQFLREVPLPPAQALARVVEHYRPRLEVLYVDDWPRRLQGLEELLTIASGYADMPLFIADVSLDSPEENKNAAEAEREKNSITLSTVHSAKGLEWEAVILLDLVEDRFPSRHAINRQEDFEEERRLMYVACTRAKDELDLFVPLSLSNRGSGGFDPATPSPFVRELTSRLHTIDEFYESYTGLSKTQPRTTHTIPFAPAFRKPDPDFFSDFQAPPKRRFGPPVEYDDEDLPLPPDEDEAMPDEQCSAIEPTSPLKLGFCKHKIFGRGKIVEHIPPDKYRVNFPGLGLKVIMKDYLVME